MRCSTRAASSRKVSERDESCDVVISGMPITSSLVSFVKDLARFGRVVRVQCDRESTLIVRFSQPTEAEDAASGLDQVFWPSQSHTRLSASVLPTLSDTPDARSAAFSAASSSPSHASSRPLISDSRDLMRRFFPAPPADAHLALLHDNEGLMYITSRYATARLHSWLAHHQRGMQLRVIDATAGLGSNTVSFALDKDHVRDVEAVELDATRFAALAHNVRAYRLDASRVRLHNADFLSWLETDAGRSAVQVPHMVFIDPPWGGKEYAQRDSIPELFLHSAYCAAAHPLAELCARLLRSPQCVFVVLKLPYNYRFSTLGSTGVRRIPQLHVGKIVFALLQR